MDAIELAEEMLDEIAAERMLQREKLAAAAAAVDAANASGDRISISENSSTMLQHMEAVSALTRALQRCQKVLDDAEREYAEQEND